MGQIGSLRGFTGVELDVEEDSGGVSDSYLSVMGEPENTDATRTGRKRSTYTHGLFQSIVFPTLFFLSLSLS